MFSWKPPLERWLAGATVVLFVPLMAAVAATVWILLEIRKEQRAIASVLRGEIGRTSDSLVTLPGELRWQLLLTVLVLVVLVAAGIGLLSVLRAYVGSQRTLHEVRMLSADILASMDHGVITTDCDGRITTANPRAQTLLDWKETHEGVLFSEVNETIRPLAEACHQVLTQAEPLHDVDFSLDRHDHARQLRADLHLLRSADGNVTGTVVQLRDVTERILMEERLRRMERFMGLGTLVAGLHHEIKNPLSALSLHVQLLEEELQERGDGALVENLTVVKTEVARILAVLETFRDFAATERLHRTATDVPRLVQQTVDLLRPKAAQHRVHMELHIPPTPWPLVTADADRLQQVLVNLVMNGIEAMRDGGKLTIRVTYLDDVVEIDVSDTGHGVPDIVRRRIFDPYFTTKRDGSGMGLAVSDKIVRQHGGQIDLKTSPQGTTFRVTLPTEPR